MSDQEETNQTTALVSNSQFGEHAPAISNSDLRTQLSQETERRSIIKEFIRDHLVEGVDYGGIHINTSCANKWNCRNKAHFSKNMLFKPGQEKFFSLFHFIQEFRIDSETKEALGNPEGLLCYLCIIYDNRGRYIANGRGAASMSEGFNANKVIKMAQKRAQADAINRSGILADFFSMEDAPEPPAKVAPKPIVATENGPQYAKADGCICNTTSTFHRRDCPLFTPPQPKHEDVAEAEVVDERPVTKAEQVEDLDDLPF